MHDNLGRLTRSCSHASGREAVCFAGLLATLAGSDHRITGSSSEKMLTSCKLTDCFDAMPPIVMPEASVPSLHVRIEPPLPNQFVQNTRYIIEERLLELFLPEIITEYS